MIYPGFLIVFFHITGCATDMNKIVHDNMKDAQGHYSRMLDSLGDVRRLPRTVDESGSLKTVKSKDWTSGFFAGSLWYLYQYSKDDQWKEAAERFTSYVEDQQFNDGTHDMGFKMLSSYGNGYRLNNDTSYKDILMQSAKTLITRFNPRAGFIRSWDHHKNLWQYPVIIDNMMNLELLFWATKASGDSTYHEIALQHADKTLQTHFRDDYSTWHVVDIDTLTGDVLGKYTHQGYAHESTWARGEAWALYAYTMCYRESGQQRYLDRARHVAEFILNHRNLPEDLVPYWDFDTPNIPDEERDVSAAAVICSALFELSRYTDTERYYNTALTLLRVLSSPEYKAEPGENYNFVLKHGVGNKRGNSEVDVPLIYADYYFIQANMRYLNYE